ncbi:MAG: dimethylarginine dimethylaminohydrolase family protein [Cryomorphaceae bacterium]|nr:amidinotransferase [Flavobacteriales bacterium]
MLELHVVNETDRLEAVVLGIADSPGPVPTLAEAYDPKSKEFIRRGEYPVEKDMVAEMDALAAVFDKYDIKVYRPEILTDVNQIFTRDIAFVVGDTLVVANVVKDRAGETAAISHLIAEIAPDKIVEMPDDVRVEGGDVMPWNGNIFMGYSEQEDFEKYLVARTNRSGVEFLKSRFPEWEVYAFELVKSDDDPRYNALHLDCCFQPIGRDRAIIFPEGFKNAADVDFLRNFFGPDRLIEITREEMYQMSSNVFSISPDVIVSERGFTRLNSELRKLGFTVEEVPYSEIGKQEGLLRCSTLPLRRKA